MNVQEVFMGVIALLTLIGGAYVGLNKIDLERTKTVVVHLTDYITRIDREMTQVRGDLYYSQLRNQFNESARGDCQAQVQLIRGMMVERGHPIPDWRPLDWDTWYRERRRQEKEDSKHGDIQDDPRLRLHRGSNRNPHPTGYHHPDDQGMEGDPPGD